MTDTVITLNVLAQVLADHAAEADMKLALALERGEALAEALVWTSGSHDFGPGGVAEVGWRRLALPAIEEWNKFTLTAWE